MLLFCFLNYSKLGWMSTVHSSPFPFAALLSTIKEALPESSQMAIYQLDSSPLLHLFAATLKTSPYLFASKEFGANTLCHALSARVNYLEVAVISCTSLLHHTAMAFFYSGLVMCTIAQSESLNFESRKHWAHTFQSALVLGASLAGVVAPSIAASLNVRIFQRAFQALKIGYQNDLKVFESLLVQGVKGVFNDYRGQILKFLIGRYPSIFCSEYDEFVTNISYQLLHAETVVDIKKVFFSLWQGSSVDDATNEQAAQLSKKDWSGLFQFMADLDVLSWNKLPDTMKHILLLVTSLPLVQLSAVTLKNLPYVLMAKQFEINDLCHALSSRVHFLEGALLSMASTIFHFAIAVLYTGIALMAAGLSKNLNYSSEKHWSHFAHGLLSTITGLIGTLVPYFGAGLYAYQVKVYALQLEDCYSEDLQLYENQVLLGIKEIYQRNRRALDTFGKWWFDTFLKIKFTPFIEYVDKSIESAEDMEAMKKLVLRIWRKFPRINPATPAEKRTGLSPAMFQYYSPRTR